VTFADGMKLFGIVVSAVLAGIALWRGEQERKKLAAVQHSLTLVENAQAETRRGVTETSLRLRERMLETVAEVTSELEAIVRRAERVSVDGPYDAQPDDESDAIDASIEFRELRDKLFAVRARAGLLPVELDDAFDRTLEVLLPLVGRETAFDVALVQRSRDALAFWIVAVRKWKVAVLEPLGLPSTTR
jgi:hypothetical protein